MVRPVISSAFGNVIYNEYCVIIGINTYESTANRINIQTRKAPLKNEAFQRQESRRRNQSIVTHNLYINNYSSLCLNDI